MSARALDERLSGAGSIPVAPCPTCERDVVAHVLLAEDGGETWACLHCDRALREIDWVEESDLARLGYAVGDPTVPAAGCGTGCGTGGCGPRPKTIDELLQAHRRL